jgi:inhibitor of KinA sporulation pathway (predicted exonuclease)
MLKTHVRTYRIADAGDITVTHWNKGEVVDLSKHYADVPHDRRHVRLESALDVFRYADGHLAWSNTPNGMDIDAAMTTRLLLGLFLDDVDRETGDQRCF